MTDQSPPAWKPDAVKLGHALDAYLAKYTDNSQFARIELLLIVADSQLLGVKRQYAATEAAMHELDSSLAVLERRAIRSET